MEQQGLHVDDLTKLRILQPELTSESETLKEECGDFVENITEFRKMADNLIDITDQVYHVRITLKFSHHNLGNMPNAKMLDFTFILVFRCPKMLSRRSWWCWEQGTN